MLQIPHNLILTYEEFQLALKHLFVKEQPHAARVLLDNSIEPKKAHLSYHSRLRPLLPPQFSETTATKDIFTEKAETQQQQLNLLTDNEKVPVDCDKTDLIEEKMDRRTESILEQLQVLEEKKL